MIQVKMFPDDADDTDPEDENDDLDPAAQEKRQLVKVVLLQP
jgi:hypothetical protein